MRWGVAAFFCFVLLGIGLALFSPILQVRQMNILRTDPRLDIEEVQRSLSLYFGKHLFFLSPLEIIADLKQAIPGIQQIEVTKQYPSELTVRITLEPLVAKLIIVSPDSATNGSAGTGAITDFLTEGGRYVVVPNTTGTDNLPTLHIVDWATYPISNQQLLSKDLLEMLWGAEQILTRQFGHTITKKTIFVRAKEFHLDTEKLSLWFDIQSSLDEQLVRYKIFLESISAENATEYIDLRLGDRVIYK